MDAKVIIEEMKKRGYAGERNQFQQGVLLVFDFINQQLRNEICRRRDARKRQAAVDEALEQLLWEINDVDKEVRHNTIDPFD